MIKRLLRLISVLGLVSVLVVSIAVVCYLYWGKQHYNRLTDYSLNSCVTCCGIQLGLSEGMADNVVLLAGPALHQRECKDYCYAPENHFFSRPCVCDFEGKDP